MKQAIRALTLATYVLYIIIMIFTVTAVYSASQLGLDLTKKAQLSTSGGTLTLSLPFAVENKGFYDIADLNITTVLEESEGVLVSNSTTLVPLIARGDKVDATHNVSISLETMSSDTLSRLLFNDTDFDIVLILATKYAHVIPLRISINSTLEWGAPLYNLALGEIPLPAFHNISHVKVIVPLSFENHSFFHIEGTMRTEIINTLNQIVGSATAQINAPPHVGYSTKLEMLLPISATNLKEVRLYFDTSAFSYGPLVMPIG